MILVMPFPLRSLPRALPPLPGLSGGSCHGAAWKPSRGARLWMWRGSMSPCWQICLQVMDAVPDSTSACWQLQDARLKASRSLEAHNSFELLTPSQSKSSATSFKLGSPEPWIKGASQHPEPKAAPRPGAFPPLFLGSCSLGCGPARPLAAAQQKTPLKVECFWLGTLGGPL